MNKFFLYARFLLLEVPWNILQKHLLLMIATLFSMSLTYGYFSIEESIPLKILDSFLYAIFSIFILFTHEMGHYINARQYGVATTLPYFIPFPWISPFGTLGAFIRMKALPPDRRALFDISFWGPAMSFLWSIPVTLIGLNFSTIYQPPFYIEGYIVGNNGILFGSSILFDFLASLTLNQPDGTVVLLHPLAFAGWVGFFVTAINLFPIGQLDGGHIAYVFLGKRQKYIAYLFLAILIYLALEVSSGWTFWVIMLIALGIRHPPVRMIHPGFDLDKTRIRLGIASALIFLLCFIPEPVKPLRPEIDATETTNPVEDYGNGKFEKIRFNREDEKPARSPWKSSI